MIILEETLFLDTGAAEFCARLAETMQKAGFHKDDQHGNGGSFYKPGEVEEVYIRGSKQSTPTALNPKNWHAMLTFHYFQRGEKSTTASIYLQVSTTGHWVTEDEKGYWQAELDALVEGMRSSVSPDGKLESLGRVIERKNRVGLLIMLAGVLIGGILGYLVGKNIFLAIAGVVVGGVLGGLIGRGLAGRGKGNLAEGKGRTVGVREKFKKDLRSWGGWLVALGLLSLIPVPGWFSPGYGVLLVLIGIASYIFHTPAMYIVYGITILGEVINNSILALARGELWLGILALIGFFIMFNVFKQFRSAILAYRSGQVELEKPMTALQEGEPPDAVETIPVDSRARFLPLIGLGLGAVGLVGSCPGLLGIGIFANSNASVANVFFHSYILMGLFGLLGLAIGLGSLLVRQGSKAASIIAVICGSIDYVGYISILIIGIMNR